MCEDELGSRTVILVCDGPDRSMLQDAAREQFMEALLAERGSDIIISFSNYDTFRDYDDALPLMLGSDTVVSKPVFQGPREPPSIVSRVHQPQLLRQAQYHPPVRRLRTGKRGK